MSFWGWAQVQYRPCSLTGSVRTDLMLSLMFTSNVKLNVYGEEQGAWPKRWSTHVRGFVWIENGTRWVGGTMETWQGFGMTMPSINYIRCIVHQPKETAFCTPFPNSALRWISPRQSRRTRDRQSVSRLRVITRVRNHGRTGMAWLRQANSVPRGRLNVVIAI